MKKYFKKSLPLETTYRRKECIQREEYERRLKQYDEYRIKVKYIKKDEKDTRK